MKWTTLTAGLVVVLVIAGTPSIAAAFTDTASTKYDAAARRLAALGIAKGVTATTFGPGAAVNRAQMAAFIIRALGREQQAGTRQATPFLDVPASHWASGYVQLASNLGISVGHAGKFRPADGVTFAEAITMLVRGLGYTDAAVAPLGAWPVGYIAKALSLGMLEGLDINAGARANRGDIALLLDNMVFKCRRPDGATLAQAVFKVSAVAAVQVTPPVASLSPGAFIQFTAICRDPTGAVVDPGAAVTWATTGSAVIGPDGRFVAYAPGVCTVRATVGQVTGIAVVNVVGTPQAVKLVLDRTSITANGQDTAQLTVSLVDAAGLPVASAAHSVHLVSSGPAKFYLGGARSASHSVAMAAVPATVTLVGDAEAFVAGTAMVRATCGSLTGAMTTLQLTAPRPGKIVLSAGAAVIEASASSRTTLTATLEDQQGVSVPATTALSVTLASSNTGVATVAAAITIPIGQKSVTLAPGGGSIGVQATAAPGVATITGSAEGVPVAGCSVTTRLAGDAHKLAFSQSAYPAKAAGQIHTFPVHLQDYQGVTKTTVSTGSGTFTGTVLVTARQGGVVVAAGSADIVRGMAEVPLTLTAAGEVTLQATCTATGIHGAAATTAVTPGAPFWLVMHEASPRTLAADGRQRARLSAAVKDQYHNPVATASPVVTFRRTHTSHYATSLPATLTVDAVGGVAEVWVTATTSPGTDTFTADAAGLASAGTAWVQTAITGLPNRLSVEPPTGTVKAGGSLTLTVYVQDAAGTAVTADQGRPVSLDVTSANAGLMSVSGAGATVNGAASFKLTSTKAIDGKEITVRATSPGLLAAQRALAPTAGVTGFVPGDPVSCALKLAHPAIETHASDSVTTLTYELVDAYGNRIATSGASGLTPLEGSGKVTITPAGDSWLVRAGTASGAVIIYDHDGRVDYGGVAVPVQPVGLTLYNAGPAHRLAVKPTAATPVAAGGDPTEGMLVRVELQDSEGRVKTSISGVTVDLVVTGSLASQRLWGWTGTAWASANSAPVLTGVAEFRLTNQAAGTVSYTAGPNGYVSGTGSGTFLAGPAQRVVYAVMPASLKADGSSIAQLKCTVADAFGNPITGHSGSMDWAIHAGDGWGRLLATTTAIVGGVAYNTLQSKFRDIPGAVVLKAWTTLPGAAAPTYTEAAPADFKVTLVP